MNRYVADFIARVLHERKPVDPHIADESYLLDLGRCQAWEHIVLHMADKIEELIPRAFDRERFIRIAEGK